MRGTHRARTWLVGEAAMARPIAAVGIPVTVVRFRL